MVFGLKRISSGNVCTSIDITFCVNGVNKRKSFTEDSYCGHKV